MPSLYSLGNRYHSVLSDRRSLIWVYDYFSGRDAHMNRLVTFGYLVSLTVSLGCSQGQPAATPEAAPVATSPAAKPPVDGLPELKPTPKNEPAVTAAGPGSTESLVATAAQGTAEATFQQTLVAFQDGRLDTAFELLPASYQSDVHKLVVLFAEKMDSDLWSQLFQLANKTSNVLKSKKEMFFSHNGLKRMPQMDAIKPHWDTIVVGLREIAESDVSDLVKLKQADLKQLLFAGNRLFGSLPLPKFGDVHVKTIKTNGDSATLSYKESSTSEAKEVEFVRVEGKWLPKSIAESWASSIDAARTRLSDLPQRISGWKPDVMKHLETISGMLDQVNSSKTAEEFNAALAPLGFTIAFTAQMAQQALQDSENSSRKEHAVSCVINRELKEAELTSLKKDILASLGDAAARTDYEVIPNDGKTRCRFTPVTEPEVLLIAIQKHFGDTAQVRLNTETKTIHVDLK